MNIVAGCLKWLFKIIYLSFFMLLNTNEKVFFTRYFSEKDIAVEKH
jgi:hypothetical protein